MGVESTVAELESRALGAARGRLSLPLAAGSEHTRLEGDLDVSIHDWAELADPASGLLAGVAADWAARGGFDDTRRPWVLTLFGIAHQLVDGTVAHLLLTDRVLDLGGLRMRLRRTAPGAHRAFGLVLEDPCPAWTGSLAELAPLWWQGVETAMRPLIHQAAEHGVREEIGWGEPVGLTTVACHALATTGLAGAREAAELLAEISGRPHLTATEDDPLGVLVDWSPRRATCCQWWQSASGAHYCAECPLPRARR